MKFHLTLSEGKNLVTGYGDGWVQINHQDRRTDAFLMTPEQVLEWSITDPVILESDDLIPAVKLAPEVFLLGTGSCLRFPPISVLKLLIDAGIGYEVMDTPAACRTYNILMSEGRNVAMGILF